jgi:hypothetical protein
MEVKTKKRGRPLGSTKKTDVATSYMFQTNFEKQIEGAPINRNSNRGYVNWGLRNDYPIKLSELYFNSIVHKSCVDFGVTAVVGDGVDYQAMNMDKTEVMPNQYQTWDEFIRCLVLDYILYGSYAFQIIRNKDGRTFSYYHQPISSVRCSPRDEEGNITSYWLCQDWTATGKYPPIEIPRFGFQEEETINSGKPYLFVYETYTPDLDYYSTPKYVGALKAIMTELELIRYDLRSVKNNFSANGFLVLPRVESDEERRDLLNNIKNSFVGADNANALVVTFSNGDENDSNVAKFVKIDKDSNNVNLFAESNQRNIDRIVTAHRIPSKALIGMPIDGATLGGGGNEVNVAWNLYNKTIATEYRNAVLTTINKMFALNGVDTELVLKPLDFNLTDEEDKVTTPAIHNIAPIGEVNKNNIEEKVVNKDEQR